GGGERGGVARRGPREQKGRNAHLDVVRGAAHRRLDLARRLRGEGECRRTDAEGDGAPGVTAHALERERRRPQHVIDRARGWLRQQERAHVLKPRCSATTPAARLK